MLEGAYLVERAFLCGLAVEEIVCVPAREAWARKLIQQRPDRSVEEPRLSLQPEAELAREAGYPFHRGALAFARRPPEREASQVAAARKSRSTLLVLPEIRDPENLGAAFRNASALGCDGILLGQGGPDPYSRRVLRVSMGASLSLPWARLASAAHSDILREWGYLRAACVLDPQAVDIRGWQVPDRCALFLGNEAYGLSETWLGVCEERITLPMAGGTDSLNVSTTAALFLYAVYDNLT